MKRDVLSYPPIGVAAHVTGDVVINYSILADGGVDSVALVSGQPMLAAAAMKQVKSWRFAPSGTLVGEHSVVFHFRLVEADPEVDSPGGALQVSTATNSENAVEIVAVAGSEIQRSGCPIGSQRLAPPSVLPTDMVETGWPGLRVMASGRVLWDPPGDWEHPDWQAATKAEIAPEKARALIEAFRTDAFWHLCTDYSRSITDSSSRFLAASLGGVERRVGEYGNSAPPSFEWLLQTIHEATNSHRWRVGDPAKEQMGDMGADIWLPKPGKTRLMTDAHLDKPEKVQADLDAGMEVNAHDESGWTSLMYAANGYNTDAGMKLLLAKGADVNARGLHGETALMFAALDGHANETLLAAGADVNAQMDGGVTVLMLLAQKGDSDELKTLLKVGAKAGAKDAHGRTAMDYLLAASCGREIVLRDTHPFMTIGYGSCNAISEDDLQGAKAVLAVAGAAQTQTWTPSAEIELKPVGRD